MTIRPLVLGGTAEATALANAMAANGIDGVFSYAGRVAYPHRQPLPTRIGGFGGVDGLVSWLRSAAISHVVDATHPFAGQMSRNSVSACDTLGIPLLALTRPPWEEGPGDRWQRVGDIEAAVDALTGSPRRIMLAVGRMHLRKFALRQQHCYIVRLVDPPGEPLPLAQAKVIVDRGPFSESADRALLERFRIDLVVSRNSGGSGARGKIDAARRLGLPVLMIDRPTLPERREVGTVTEVLDWLETIHRPDSVTMERGV